MLFELTILGSSSAVPVHDRHPSAQVLNIRDKLFLIDCGEGTQMQLIRYKIKRSRIRHLFISHMHGDHYFGLFGLLTTYHLLGRQDPLEIFGPPELKEAVLSQMKFASTQLRYPVIFHPIVPAGNTIIFEDDDVRVIAFPLRHSVPCMGFLFREKSCGRKIIGEKIAYYQIPFDFIPQLRQGRDYIDQQGKIIRNEELTTEGPPPRSYAYCTDTTYTEAITQYVAGVDLLYHEATFSHQDVARAAETFHATAAEAALVAKKAGVKQLIIGHLSAKYKDGSSLLEEAKAIFNNTKLAIEGETISI